MKKILLFFCALQSLLTFAQAPADIDHNFGPGPGFGARVECMVTQPDGKIIIKGSAVYRSRETKVLIRVSPDGTPDPTFDYNVDSSIFTIKSIALQPDGKVLLGGNDNGDKTLVIRLNADGSKDTSFQFGAAVDNGSFVNAIILQSDGKILVSNKRNFSAPKKRLIRLNTDGSVDPTFDIGTGFDNDINAVAVQSDGKIIAGGSFSTFQGVAQKYLIRLNPDGTKDTSFNTGSGFIGSNYIFSVVIQKDGKIIAGGGFISYQGVAQKYLIRLNTDGSNDTSFVNPVVFKTMSYLYVNTICLQPDGKLIANFYDSGGNSASSSSDDSVYRFNSDGSFDTIFPKAYFNDSGNPLTGFKDAEVRAIVLLNSGKILIGGKFVYCRRVVDKNIVCLDTDGSRDSSFNKDTGLDAAVNCSAVQTDGKTLIGGSFENFQGVTQKKLIRLNVDGSKDTSFNPQFQFNDVVQSILLQSDGKVLVRGKFTDYGASNRNYLARLNPDGTLDTSFAKRFGYEYNVEVMALQPDGKILLSAFVDSYPNLPYRKLFRLNSDGSQDISFVAGNRGDFSVGVSAIVVQPDGKILVGGSFTTFKGTAQKYLIRLNTDGSKDTSFDMANAFDFSIGVSTITLQPDGKVLISGVSSPSAGNYESFLTRLNSDGSKDISFNEAIVTENVGSGYSAAIIAVILQNDGKILVGGEFDAYQGIAQNGLSRLNTDGTLDTSFDAGTGFGVPVQTLSLTHDGKINVGGVFLSYKGVTSSYFIRLKGTDVQPALEATTIQSNVTCPGSLTGSASIVTVYNGKGSYSYLWSNGATTATITELAAGDYSCKITDADLATVTKRFILISDKGPDVTITNNAGTLAVAETGAVYKWLTCNNGIFTPVPNENKSVFTPKQAGSYAVEVTKNECTVTSTCFDVAVLGTKDFDIQNSFKLYPNPVKDFITIETDLLDHAKLNIFNVTGQIILSKELKATATRLNISDLPSGVYMFQISNDTGTTTKKVIKN